MEHRLDEKDQKLYHLGQESRSKIKFLKRVVQDLRRQYAGAVPLVKQERFSLTLLKLLKDKSKAEQELLAASEQRHKAETRAAELDLQKHGLQELISTLKDGRGAAKVAEWHTKMEELRLVELRSNREALKLKEKVLL